MDLSNYIDFEKLWKDIAEYWDGELDEIEDERIRLFLKDNQDLELVKSDCHIEQDEVTFCFGLEFQTANESNPCNEWFSLYIVYDIGEDCFCRSNTEQG